MSALWRQSPRWKLMPDSPQLPPTLPSIIPIAPNPLLSVWLVSPRVHVICSLCNLKSRANVWFSGWASLFIPSEAYLSGFFPRVTGVWGHLSTSLCVSIVSGRGVSVISLIYMTSPTHKNPFKEIFCVISFAFLHLQFCHYSVGHWRQSLAHTVWMFCLMNPWPLPLIFMHVFILPLWINIYPDFFFDAMQSNGFSLT